MYKIRDLQIDRYLADGSLFKSLDECKEHLINYHSIDQDIKSLKIMSLSELCELYLWRIEDKDGNEITIEE